MWLPSLRFCLFFCIYQNLFQLSITNSFVGDSSQISTNIFSSTDYDKFFETIKSEYPDIFSIDFVDQKEDEYMIYVKDFVTAQMQIFFEEYSSFELVLRDGLSNWNKTFDIIKAVLCCFMLEKKYCQNGLNSVLDTDLHNNLENNLENTSNLKDLFDQKGVSTYIKLAEEFTVLANVKLVHAVLSKVSPKVIQNTQNPIQTNA